MTYCQADPIMRQVGPLLLAVVVPKQHALPYHLCQWQRSVTAICVNLGSDHSHLGQDLSLSWVSSHQKLIKYCPKLVQVVDGAGRMVAAEQVVAKAGRWCQQGKATSNGEMGCTALDLLYTVS